MGERRPVLSHAMLARVRSPRGAVAVGRTARFAGDRRREGMNKTEARYADTLDAMIAAGHVSEWHYEPMALKLADELRWHPDFLVVTDAGEMELHEVKGQKRGAAEKYHVEDDARAKLRVAARQYPFRVVVVWPNNAGGWHREEIGA